MKLVGKHESCSFTMFGARVSFIFSSWAVVLGTGLLFGHGSFFFRLVFLRNVACGRSSDGVLLTGRAGERWADKTGRDGWTDDDHGNRIDRGDKWGQEGGRAEQT